MSESSHSDERRDVAPRPTTPVAPPEPVTPAAPLPLPSSPAGPSDPLGGESGADDPAAGFAAAPLDPSPGPVPRRRGRRVVPAEQRPPAFTPQQRLLILDAWQRSGLPARDFAPLVGLSRHTLYSWKQGFEQHGPEGLLDQPRGAPSGSNLPE